MLKINVEIIDLEVVLDSKVMVEINYVFLRGSDNKMTRDLEWDKYNSFSLKDP